MSIPRKILVVGATGKQGCAFIRAATSASGSNNDHDAGAFHLLALTRNPASPAAKALANLEQRVSVVAADLDSPDSIRKLFEDEKAKPEGGIWGVFVAIAFPGLGADASGEERQGKLIADLAHEYRVQHLIYSSASRRHESHDDETTLSGRAKVLTERHIKSLDGLNWTILQPTFFMENFDNGVISRITISVLRVGMKVDTKLQLITADDIGGVAHAVMQAPEAHRGKVITVIGDILTTREIQEAYKRGAGCPMPSVPNILARVVLATNKHTRALINNIENGHADRLEHHESYDDLIARCKSLYPNMQNFETWAKVRGSTKDKSPAGNWNNVTLRDLLLGKR